MRIPATAVPELRQKHNLVISLQCTRSDYVHARHRRVRRAGTSWTCTEAEKSTDLCTAKPTNGSLWARLRYHDGMPPCGSAPDDGCRVLHTLRILGFRV